MAEVKPKERSMVRRASKALIRRASKSFHESSGLEDLEATIASLGERNELYKLDGEYNIHFHNEKVEQEFRTEWRRLGIFQGIVTIIVLFMAWKAVSVNMGVLTDAENWGTTAIVMVFGIAILVLTVVAPNVVKRHYDTIVVSYLTLECTIVMMQLLLMSRGTIADTLSDTNFACLAPACEAVSGNPSVIVMSLLFIGTTTLRLRFVPATMFSLMVVLVEEITLNIDVQPDALDIINQVIALLLVIYEGLLAAHQLEVTHRKIFVLQRYDHKSSDQIHNEIVSKIYPCCPRKNIKNGCLRFKSKKDEEKFLTEQYAVKFEEGVGLWGLCTATVMTVFFYLLELPAAGGPEIQVDAGLRDFGLPENSDYDWRLDYTSSFIPLFILLPFLLAGAAFEAYIQKKALQTYKKRSAKSRRVGFLLFAALPLFFGFMWNNAVSANYGNAINHLYADSPMEKAKCLSQSDWADILENGDIADGTWNTTVCEMTATYNATTNTPCDSKEFESITQYCTYYAMFALNVFVFQTQALWIVPDMLKGSIILVVTGLYALIAGIVNVGPQAITLDAVRVLPLVVGAILCLYEQTITAQRAFILSRHTARRKSMVMTGLDSAKFNIEDDIEDAKISRDSSSIQESFTKSKNAVAPDGLDGEKEARRSNFELPNMTFQNMKRESGEQQSQRKLKEKKEKIRGIQLIGQGLPDDFEYKTYPKSPKEAELIRTELLKSDLLKELGGEQLDQVVDAFEAASFKGGEVIIRQGDKDADYAYILQSGEAHVFVDGTDVYHYCGGGMFGDVALYMAKPRNATVKAGAEGCKCWRIDRATFQFTVTHGYKKEGERTVRALKTCKMFQTLSEELLVALASCTVETSFEKGTTIIKKGESGADAETFYFLTAGTIEFSDFGGGSDATSQITPESELHYFGERALITNEPRAATATAVTDATCITLIKKDLLKYVGDLKELMEVNFRRRFLAEVEFFSGMGEMHRTNLFPAFRNRTFQQGDVVTTEGEVGWEFYTIREGKVQVSSAGGGDMAVLEGGKFFGEEALDEASTGERVATVTCLEKTDVFYVSRQDFVRHVGGAYKEVLEMERKRSEMAKKERERGKKIKFRNLKEIAMLGSGTFGRVALVKDTASGETFALKRMQKAKIVEFMQQKNVQNERDIMVQADHPFILKLVNTYQDKFCVYMLLEKCMGGELFTFLHCRNRTTGLTVTETRFYGACVLDGLAFLHDKHICFRDLKPENLLIDSDGYGKIIDFGFAKVITGRSYTLCGTPEYLSPELVTSKGHGKGVDYWALGVLMFEMLFLHSPFCGPDQDPNKHQEILRNIVRGKFVNPGRGDKSGSSRIGKLIRLMLTKDERKRGGCMKDGAGQLKRDMETLTPKSPFQFSALLAKEYVAPWKPPLKGQDDHTNFDPYDDDDEIQPYVGTRFEDNSGWDKDF